MDTHDSQNSLGESLSDYAIKNVICIDEYYLESKLNEKIPQIRCSGNFFGPIGVILTLMAAIGTGSFHNVGAMSSDIIEIVFSIFLILSIIWLFVEFGKFLNSENIESLMREIRKEAFRPS